MKDQTFTNGIMSKIHITLSDQNSVGPWDSTKSKIHVSNSKNHASNFIALMQ